MMEIEEHDHFTETTNLELSNAATTIDPSNRPSRISQSVSLQMQEEHDEQQPHFPKLNALQSAGGKTEYRRVRCPPHRYTPLRDHWEQILTPLVEYLKLQVRACVLEAGLYLNWYIHYTLQKMNTSNLSDFFDDCVVPVTSNPFSLQEASIVDDDNRAV